MCDRGVCVFLLCRCNCSEHGTCSPVNGSCGCDAGWTGQTCNDSAIETSGLEEGEGNHSSTTSSGLGEEAYTTEPLEVGTEATTLEEKEGEAATTSNIEIKTPPTRQEAPPTTKSCQQTNNFHINVAVATVIVTGFVSVLVHVLICWMCHRKSVSEHFGRGLRQRSKLKRRKLRKKPAFMRLAIQSSSDCSI